MAAKSNDAGLDKLKDVGQELMRNLGDRALDSINDKLSGLTDKLGDIGEGGPIGKAVAKGGEAAAKGDNPLLGGLKGAASGIKDKVTGGGGGKGGKGEATHSTNIIESIDVGVPVYVAYNQWTEFGDFPSFMKKVENVDAEEENKLKFKAQIFLSHRTWEATILEQVPDERIVWRSQGEKGHVDGAVSFHELAPNLTRILVVLEYYPQGLFEKTGNLWRAQGRRARAELRHFRRHVMTRSILEADEIEGWRGVIEDGEVVESHEEHVQHEEEQAEQDQQEQQDQAGDEEYDEEPEDEQEEPEDEYDDAEGEEEPEDADESEEPEDAEDYEDEEPEDEEPEDEEDDFEEDEYEGDEVDEPEDEPEDEEDVAEEEGEAEEEPPRRRHRRAS